MSTHAIELNASPELSKISDSLIAQKLYTREELTALLGPLSIDKGVLKLFSRQAEAKSWHGYRKIFLKNDRINAGVRFLQTHQKLLKQVEAQYGVPTEIITALIGVETFYGTRMGSRNVLRSLATLAAAYPRRAQFFAKELETFLTLLKTEQLTVANIEGSYAGAIGIPQFMPTSYAAYSVDFNQNGRRDLVNELEDAVASVANYLTVHGWRRNEPIATWLSQTPSTAALGMISKRAKPVHTVSTLRQNGVSFEGADHTPISLNQLKAADGMRYFIGYTNFYALTRYNPSNKYAMAIVELARAITAAQ